MQQESFKHVALKKNYINDARTYLAYRRGLNIATDN